MLSSKDELEKENKVNNDKNKLYLFITLTFMLKLLFLLYFTLLFFMLWVSRFFHVLSALSLKCQIYKIKPLLSKVTMNGNKKSATQFMPRVLNIQVILEFKTSVCSNWTIKVILCDPLLKQKWLRYPWFSIWKCIFFSLQWLH